MKKSTLTLFSVLLNVLFGACAHFNHFPVAERYLGSEKVCIDRTKPTPSSISIILDPGHNPSSEGGGALGVTGISEVTYNDNFVKALADAYLKIEPCTQLYITRRPNQSLTLAERVAVINAIPNALLISIHHDSVQAQDLELASTEKCPTCQRTRSHISGHSLYLSPDNPQYKQGLALAEALATKLKALGRTPSLYHSKDIPGERRQIVNAEIGILHHPEIAVLKKTKHPAVLIEIGFIPDPEDERLVTSSQFIQNATRAIAEGTLDYLRTKPTQ